MKRKILNVIRGLYFYYSTGATYRIPYFKTISVLTLVILLHFFQIGIIIYKLSGIKIDLFSMPDTSKAAKYLFLFLYLVPIYLILTRVFPKKSLINHNLDDSFLRKQRNIFFYYGILNVILLLILISDKISFNKA